MFYQCNIFFLPLSGFFKCWNYVPSLLENFLASLKLLELVFYKFSGTWTLKNPKIGYPTRVYSWFEYLMPSLVGGICAVCNVMYCDCRSSSQKAQIYGRFLKKQQNLKECWTLNQTKWPLYHLYFTEMSHYHFHYY